MLIQNNKSNKGIALLTSVLVVSVILAIALTLMSLVVKQFLISSSAQQSVLSIYAADAGMECALLYDIRGTEAALNGDYVFATSTSNLNNNTGAGLTCFGLGLSNYSVVDNVNSATTSFEVSFPSGGFPTRCTRVEVAKNFDGITNATKIVSKGYNVSCARVGTSPRVVERALRVDYVFN